jgi:hypothetical protein
VEELIAVINREVVWMMDMFGCLVVLGSVWLGCVQWWLDGRELWYVVEMLDFSFFVDVPEGAVLVASGCLRLNCMIIFIVGGR